MMKVWFWRIAAVGWLVVAMGLVVAFGMNVAGRGVNAMVVGAGWRAVFSSVDGVLETHWAEATIWSPRGRRELLLMEAGWRHQMSGSCGELWTMPSEGVVKWYVADFYVEAYGEGGVTVPLLGLIGVCLTGVVCCWWLSRVSGRKGVPG